MAHHCIHVRVPKHVPRKVGDLHREIDRSDSALPVERRVQQRTLDMCILPCTQTAVMLKLDRYGLFGVEDSEGEVGVRSLMKISKVARNAQTSDDVRVSH